MANRLKFGRGITFVVTLFVMLMSAASVWAAGKKVAMVISNEAYRNYGRVFPAAQDTAALVSSLKGLGFKVHTAKNLKRGAFYQRISTFTREAKDAEVSFFYYIGHGAHHEDRSYLVASDADVSLLLHLDHSLIDIDILLDQLATTQGRSVAVFDASWQNSIMSKVTQGQSNAALGFIKANPDQIVISANSAKKALPLRRNSQSHLVESLVEMLDKDAISMERVAKRTKGKVSRKSGRKQIMVFDNRLAEALILNPRLGPDPNSAEAIFWNTIQNSEDPNVLRAYVSQFPNGFYVGIAKQKIGALEAIVEPEPEPEPEPLRFTVRRMNAVYVTKRRSNLRAQPTTESARVGSIQSGSEVRVTGKVRNLPWYRILYRNGDAYIYETLIEKPRPADEQAWLKVKDSDDTTELRRFINQYPSSSFVAAARQKLFDILDQPEPTPEPQPAPVVNPSTNRYIVTRQGNLRAAPDANSQFLGSVGVGEYVTVLSKVNGLNWYRARAQGGITAYVWGRLIEPAPATAPVADNRDKQLWDWAKSVKTIRAYNRYLNQFPNGQYANKARRRMNRLITEGNQQQSQIRTITVAPVVYRNNEFPTISSAITQALGNLQNTQATTGHGQADIVVKTEVTNLDISQTADSSSIGLSLGAALLGGRQGSDILQNLGNAMQHKVRTSVRLTATNRSNGQSIVVDASAKTKAPGNISKKDAAARAIKVATDDAAKRLVAEISQKWSN